MTYALVFVADGISGGGMVYVRLGEDRPLCYQNMARNCRCMIVFPPAHLASREGRWHDTQQEMHVTQAPALPAEQGRGLQPHRIGSTVQCAAIGH